jgi:hypothetical protein
VPPTKRNDAIIERMLRVARTGLPMKFVATAGGISRETLNEWRNADAALNQKIEKARLAAVEARPGDDTESVGKGLARLLASRQLDVGAIKPR